MLLLGGGVIMNFWDLWWIIPLIMIALCIFMMVFMMRGCMRKMKHMMAGASNAGSTGTGFEMAHCPCITMMGRFMKGPAPQKEQSNEQGK
jgi:hypothetical protein